MSHGKQFTLFSHVTGPNGWKVALVLEELGLTYETVYFDFGKNEQKSPEHIKYNPNGRIPTLVDHGNDDFAVWESNAVLIYLVEKYDGAREISAIDANEKIVQLQWLFFQASDQDAYFKQASWFRWRHPERIPSAIERYQQESMRILGVLENVLSQQEWLVGNKCTIADLSFIPWNIVAVTEFLADYNGFNFKRDFPAVCKWHDTMLDMGSIRKTLAIKQSLMA